MTKSSFCPQYATVKCRFCPFVRFCHFFWAQNTKYFKAKLTWIEYILAYIFVFFQDFWKVQIQIFGVWKKKNKRATWSPGPNSLIHTIFSCLCIWTELCSVEILAPESWPNSQGFHIGWCDIYWTILILCRYKQKHLAHWTKSSLLFISECTIQTS
jgi:hypothetical protein